MMKISKRRELKSSRTVRTIEHGNVFFVLLGDCVRGPYSTRDPRFSREKKSRRKICI